MAAVEGESVQFLFGELEAIQTHGDPSSFQNSYPGIHAADTSELSSTTQIQEFLNVAVRVVLHAACLDVSTITNRTRSCLFITSLTEKVKKHRYFERNG